MKFSTLNPVISATDITFDCVKCGPPYKVWISARYRQPPQEGIWCWDAPEPNSANFNGYDSITITPSIRNHHHGKKLCGWHLSVNDGEVQT